MSSVYTSDLALRVIREGLLLVLLVSAPPLLISLIVGFLVSLLQAATQLQDQTLSFVPKLLSVSIVLIALGPILSVQLLRFTQALLQAIPFLR
jgi:flagellar biosynthetic protein FliQ